MLVFGPVSSIFDFHTFYALIQLFGAGEELFHTGWFVESLATQVLVVLAIRTRRPLFRSRPHIFLGSAAIGIVLLAVVLPFTPVSPWLGFVAPPPLFFVYLIAATAAYLALVEITKYGSIMVTENVRNERLENKATTIPAKGREAR
jgi:P-type Mg2+ transporter